MRQKENTASRWLIALWQYAVFFLLIAFVVTCCMLLFLEILQKNMGLTLTQEGIETAAKLTFGNIALISLLCTVIDGVRRWYMVTRPVQRIADAAEKLSEGNFSVRLQPVLVWTDKMDLTPLSTPSIEWRKNCPALKPCGRILSPTCPMS